MQSHINQALHNEKFVEECCVSYPDSYFDWKVTATFYCALHLFRAFCEKRGINAGSTHDHLASMFDPKRNGGNPPTSLKKHIWSTYSTLQKYSEHARYETFLDPEIENEIQRDNFSECQKLLSILKDYFNQQGIPCKKAA